MGGDTIAAKSKPDKTCRVSEADEMSQQPTSMLTVNYSSLGEGYGPMGVVSMIAKTDVRSPEHRTGAGIFLQAEQVSDLKSALPNTEKAAKKTSFEEASAE